MDPLTPIAATINSSLRIFEVTYQLKAVGEQTADVLKTTRHVDTNLNEGSYFRSPGLCIRMVLGSGSAVWRA